MAETDYFEVDSGVVIGTIPLLRDASGELELSDSSVDPVLLREIIVGHYSYKIIEAASSYLIPTVQQMAVFGRMVLDGELQVDGEIYMGTY